MEKIVQVNRLIHFFGERMVLDDINLEIGKGEILGLLGPSGAGKTTLIKILTGQLKHTEGTVQLFGKSSTKLTGQDYKKIGIMMDHFGLYERLNCFDNLKFFSMLRENSTEHIMEILKKIGLADSANTMVANLSKGMKGRLLLARAMLGTPEILFLDEPTSGLDPVTAEEIHKLILEEKQKGTTIFLTTHNMTEAEKLCDNVALLNDGKIVKYGNPKEICRKYNHQKRLLVHLYDGTDVELFHDASSSEQLIMYLKQGKLETIHSTEPNLENVFMELTGRKFE